MDVFSLSRQVSWLAGRNCFRSSQCQGISDVKSGATRCLQLRGQRRNPAQDARTTDFPLSYQILGSDRTVTSTCGNIRREVSMGRKARTQNFWVENRTSRENQTRQAAVAASSHAPFCKWLLSGASPFADFSKNRLAVVDGQLFTVGPPVPSRSEARAGFEKSCSLRFRETSPRLPETPESEPPPALRHWPPD